MIIPVVHPQPFQIVAQYNEVPLFYFPTEDFALLHTVNQVLSFKLCHKFADVNNPNI